MQRYELVRERLEMEEKVLHQGTYLHRHHHGHHRHCYLFLQLKQENYDHLFGTF